MRIFITRNGQQLGPYTLDQIQGQVNAGTLEATDWAWYEGITDWVPVNHIPGFNNAPMTRTGAPAASSPPPAPQRRPVLVWVISIFFLITLPLALLSLALIPLMASGIIPVSDAQRAYFQSQGIVDYALSALTLVLNIAGVIFLFLLRRPALYCFGGGFFINVLNSIYQIIFKDWIGAISSSSAGMIGAIIGAGIAVTINLAIFLYVLYLYVTKVLR